MLAVLCWPVVVCAGGADRAAVPDAPAQLRAERTVREVFEADYAQRAPEQRRALAQRLLRQAQQTRDDPAGRYVLLREARDLAAGAADADTAHRALREMSRLYAIDPIPATLAMLMTAHRAANTPEAYAPVSRVAMAAAEDAVLADDYERAGQLLALADTAARQARELALVNRVGSRARELTAIAAEYAQIPNARDALAKAPDDPQANLLLGRFACAIKNDWEAGLPHLSRGADASLAALAQLDLARPADAARRLELANGWWEYAGRQGELARRHVQGRAGFWYRQALPKLSGLNRALAQKRLDEIELATLLAQNLQPGLRAELFKGVGLSDPAGQRVDGQIDFDWGMDAPDPALPKDNFSLRWTGLLRPPAAGTYELVIIANTGVRIWIDDKPVLDEADLSRARNGKRLPVQLPGPLHPIRVEYWDTTGLAKMKLHWIAPGSEKPEPIPASAFWHEPGQ